MSSRQNFNEGQEIVYQDLNTLQGRMESTIFDKVISEILGNKTDAFFQDGFLVSRLSSVSVSVKAGVGFQAEDTGSKEPINKLLARGADLAVAVNTPDSSNPRIDIIVVKNARYNSEQENRKFKDEFSEAITTQLFTIATDYKAEILYIAGIPAGSPAVPATPAGYIKISTINVSASTGIAVSGAISDDREPLPIATSVSPTGSSEYDAIVGVVGVDQGATYGDLKSALDNALDGWKILVLNDEAVNAIPVVTKNNIEIIFKRGATISKGTAVAGLQVDGNDCRIVNARFLDFDTGGDFGIITSIGALRSIIDAPRFNNCDSNISDLGSESYITVEYTE